MEEVKNNTNQFIIVKFDEEHYGINIGYIENIVRMQSITRVPKAPSYIKGVINLRGEIIPIMCLRKKFGLAEEDYTNKTRIIIVKLDQSAMGLIVDEVKEVMELPETAIEKMIGDPKDEKSSFLWGVGKSEGDLISLLNINTIVNGKENN